MRQTGIDVAVPVDALVDHWRVPHDPSAADGMPAHITLVFPFLPEAEIDLDAVRQLVAEVPAFDFALTSVSRFPQVVYLAPEPVAPFVALTHAFAERWPEAPPYGGAFSDVVPHLTIAQSADPLLLEAIAIEAEAILPLPARAESVALHAQDDAGIWRARATFPLAGA